MDQLTLGDIAKQAIEAAGGASVVARKITALEERKKPLTPQAVQKWSKAKCPAERVLQLEAMQAEIKRFDLRPDLYPQEKTPSAS